MIFNNKMQEINFKRNSLYEKKLTLVTRIFLRVESIKLYYKKTVRYIIITNIW